MACGADQVLVSSGSQQGIDLVGKLFTDEGSSVLLEAPTYLATIQALGVYGAEFQGLPLSGYGIDPDALRRAIAHRRPAFVYLIPTFQNPSGCCYTGEVRRAVAEILDETGIPLIEDDPYRDLAYQPVERTPICAYLQSATGAMGLSGKLLEDHRAGIAGRVSRRLAAVVSPVGAAQAGQRSAHQPAGPALAFAISEFG